MQNDFFINKNVLLLFSVSSEDENQYYDFHNEILRKYFKNTYSINFLEHSLRKGIRNTERYIEEIVSEKNIDVVMVFSFASVYDLSVEFYSKIKTKINLIFWMFDDENYFDAYSKYYCQIADAVVTTDYFSVFSYKKLSIPSVLYFSSHSKNNYYPIKSEKDIDVCFLGDCRKHDRMEYINFLMKNGVNIKTFGAGSMNGFVEWSDFSKIFSRSKINLNFTKIDKLNWINRNDPLLNKVGQPKGRPIEIALTKSFCLSEYAPALNEMFEIGKEIDVFQNKDELLEKVKYYLSNEFKREEIAGNAYKKATNNYESDVYIPRVLKELERFLQSIHRQEKHKIFLSNSFKIKSINGLSFSMFVFIKNGKIGYALELFKELFKYGVFNFFAGFSGGLIRVIKHIIKNKDDDKKSKGF